MDRVRSKRDALRLQNTKRAQLHGGPVHAPTPRLTSDVTAVQRFLSFAERLQTRHGRAGECLQTHRELRLQTHPGVLANAPRTHRGIVSKRSPQIHCHARQIGLFVSG
eukprot:3870264-Prymnesium_polylepis.1